MALEAARPTPPPTVKGDVVETHFGVEVADPYRWLEDADSPETRAWIEAQNAVTFAFLRDIPEWTRIRQRMEELITFERFGIPELVGDGLAYTRNTGTQNQSVIYLSDRDGSNPRVLLDPNALSDDGTVAVGAWSFSFDGKLFAYALTRGGSDWLEWHVRDVATGEDLPDLVRWSKFSYALWSADSLGFYYSAYDAPTEGEALQAANFYQKVYYHRIGTDQSADELIYENRDEPEWGYNVGATEDGRYALLMQRQGTRPENRIYVRDLANASGEFRPLFDKFDASYRYIGNDGSRFYFLTDNGAPRQRVIAVDADRPQPENWETVVPEAAESLEGASLVGDTLFASYLRDARSVVLRYDLRGKPLGEVALPGIGTAGGFDGHRSDGETFFSFTGYTAPGIIFRLDLATGSVTEFKRPELRFNPDEFETKQVFFNSKDGTRVPIFLTSRKGVKLDGSNPTLLYGYGGFSVPITPGFSTRALQWLELGGIYAVANIRGGGEYGREWYDAGRLERKQNGFDDFIAAAEYLIAEGYTSTPHLAIEGGSNGGLLIGACMTQRPDLFGACLPHVGVLDMLRFHRFTIGYAWKSDYGDPEVEADFRTLLKYSPLHNLKPGTAYPPTLIFTGDHDDRVVPAHSFKFAAALQAAQGGQAPVLIRVETSAGHGAGKPISKILDESSDALAFLVATIGRRA